jgi:hypothetical protein
LRAKSADFLAFSIAPGKSMQHLRYTMFA